MSLDHILNKILIIDFGSQFTQLIARRIRELGVYSEIISHKQIKNRLKIPMKNNMRSLNVASSVAIILAESLKQTKLI